MRKNVRTSGAIRGFCVVTFVVWMKWVVVMNCFDAASTLFSFHSLFQSGFAIHSAKWRKKCVHGDGMMELFWRIRCWRLMKIEKYWDPLRIYTLTLRTICTHPRKYVYIYVLCTRLRVLCTVFFEKQADRGSSIQNSCTISFEKGGEKDFQFFWGKCGLLEDGEVVYIASCLFVSLRSEKKKISAKLY